MTRPPDPTYRVLVYKLTSAGEQTTIMDSTGQGFIAATGTLQDGDIQGDLGDSGPPHLQRHLANFIARQKYPS